jgi:hypothetical protein
VDEEGPFYRTPPAKFIEQRLAEVQADDLVVPQAEGESLWSALEDATEDPES